MTDCEGLLTNSHTLLLNARRYEKKKILRLFVIRKARNKRERKNSLLKDTIPVVIA